MNIKEQNKSYLMLFLIILVAGITILVSINNKKQALAEAAVRLAEHQNEANEVNKRLLKFLLNDGYISEELTKES